MTGNLEVTSSGGSNHQGLDSVNSYGYLMSGGTGGKLYFTIGANSINEGKPAEIIGIKTKTSCPYGAQADTFSWYFVNTEKQTATLSQNIVRTLTWGQKTIDYFNSFRDERKCFSKAKSGIALHIADTSYSSSSQDTDGNIRIARTGSVLTITWKALNQAKIFVNGQWINAEPHIYTQSMWIPVDFYICHNNEWKN